MGRLKGIPSILSPELLHTLASMGHGDIIVLADANFPTSSICRCGPKEIRADGHDIPTLLEAILQLMPIDTYPTGSESIQVAIMDLVETDKAREMEPPGVWKIYQNLVDKAENRKVPFTKLDRYDFYNVAKTSFAVVHTGETALYGNIMLRMGVIAEKKWQGCQHATRTIPSYAEPYGGGSVRHLAGLRRRLIMSPYRARHLHGDADPVDCRNTQKRVLWGSSFRKKKWT